MLRSNESPYPVDDIVDSAGDLPTRIYKNSVYAKADGYEDGAIKESGRFPGLVEAVSSKTMHERWLQAEMRKKFPKRRRAR